MKLSKPFKGVIHIDVDSQYELTSTFMRLQEFYESPFEGFKGCFFTLEDYMDRYAEYYGNFTYNIDWNGFNVPGNIVKRFFSDEFFMGRLLNKEFKMLEAIAPYMKDEHFYLIGTHGSDAGYMAHEQAHAFYYLNPEYKAEMDALTETLDEEVRGSIHDVLIKMGYCDEVLDDELQAYLSTDEDGDSSLEDAKLPSKDILTQYRNIYTKYEGLMKNED